MKKSFLGVSFYPGLWCKWGIPPSLILNIFTIWTEWAATPKVCIIYPDSMIYLPVQFHALCSVLSRVLLSFNTKCLIMPHATLIKKGELNAFVKLMLFYMDTSVCLNENCFKRINRTVFTVMWQLAHPEF